MTDEQLGRLLDVYTALIEEGQRDVQFYEGLIQVQERLQRVFEDNSGNGEGQDDDRA